MHDDQGLLSPCWVLGHFWAVEEHTPERCIKSPNKSISEQEPDLLLHRHPSGKTEQAAKAEDVTVPSQRLRPCHTHSGISTSGNVKASPPKQRDMAVAPTIGSSSSVYSRHDSKGSDGVPIPQRGCIGTNDPVEIFFFFKTLIN